MVEPSSRPVTLRWIGDLDGHLRLIDQTRLPHEAVELECQQMDTVWEAIRELRVRGAPAIGLAAAYGAILGLRNTHYDSLDALAQRLEEVCQYLGSSRPTAVNLFWALDQLRGRLRAELGKSPVPSVEAILLALLQEAHRLVADDTDICLAIGRHGASLLTDGCGVLTHCNAGGLATSGPGTALAVLYACQEQGRRVQVFADETRPLLQGARLTAWELLQHGLDVTLICDSMAAQVMKEGRVQAVLVGADRIAANGDTANKIGTYGLAVLAHAHRIPFYVAAPVSTFDLTLPHGDLIPIEERSATEVTCFAGRRTAPEGVRVYNPAFDVTPAALIAAIITERGLIQPVNQESVQRVVASPRPR